MHIGLCRRIQATPALVLGGHQTGVSLLALAAAYRAIAAGGRYKHPRFVRHIEFSDGRFVWIPRSPQRQVVQGFAALKDLQAALAIAGRNVSDNMVAGKTGSTRTGSLFAGYDGRITVAIWIEYSRMVEEDDTKAIRSATVFNQIVEKSIAHDQ